VPPPLVQLSLSLRRTCGSDKLNVGDKAQVVLHAVSGTVDFTAIVHGDVSSRDTNSKRIEGTFAVQVEDPRCPATPPPGSTTVPPCGWGIAPSHGNLTGQFKFFYQRGGPAQPFP
jgi:hypothetical protein